MAAKRVYVVRTVQGAGQSSHERLVRAANVSQAIRHVSSPMYTAEVASQDDLLRLAKTTDVEDAAQEAGE